MIESRIRKLLGDEFEIIDVRDFSYISPFDGKNNYIFIRVKYDLNSKKKDLSSKLKDIREEVKPRECSLHYHCDYITISIRCSKSADRKDKLNKLKQCL